MQSVSTQAYNQCRVVNSIFSCLSFSPMKDELASTHRNTFSSTSKVSWRGNHWGMSKNMLLHSTIKSIRAANDVSSHQNTWWSLKQGIAPIMQCSCLSKCVVLLLKNLCSWIKTFCHFRCPFRDSHTINWIKRNS